MKQILVITACLFLLAGCGSGDSNDQSSNAGNSGNGQKTSQQSGKTADKQSSKSADATSDKSSASQDDQSGSASGGDFASKKAKRSYALGMNIGNSLKTLPVDIDSDLLSEGITDVVDNNKTRLSDKQVRSIMSDVVDEMRSKQQKKAKKQAAQNLEQSKEFLADNKTKDGVKTTDSGLQYKVLHKGSGQSPDANDKVTVTYTGTLPNGKVFDSTDKDNKPATFPVNAVIPGWTEALQLMKPGAEYKLFIPPKLAYGKRGAGSTIGPNQVLIFDVTLKKVERIDGTGESKSGSKMSDDTANDSQSSMSGADNAGDSGASMQSDDTQPESDETGQSSGSSDDSAMSGSGDDSDTASN